MVYGVVKQNELPGGNMKNGLNTTYISPSLESKLSEIPDHLVTTIIAAAGYGKTRAVRWWIDENCAKDDIVFSMTVMRDLFPSSGSVLFPVLKNGQKHMTVLKRWDSLRMPAQERSWLR